jgi:hypothetical protein
MSKTQQIVLALTAVVGAVMTIAGGALLVTGTPYESCYTSYTGMWGILPATLGLAVLLGCAFTAWDKSGR